MVSPEVVNIVCTIDESYVPFCGIMLYSLACKNPHSNLHVFILHNGLQPESELEIKDFLSQFISYLSFIKIDDSFLINCPISCHVSIATYFRLLIPEVIPDNIDKILFLDSDIIIRKNIISLWNTNIDHYSHAAVTACDSMAFSDKERLGIPISSPYFNAGLMLINLNYWRKEKIFYNALEFINSQFERILWWDQDVLNYLLYDRWLPIDPTWNAQGDIFQARFASLPEFNSVAYKNALKDPAIVHFSGSGICKPWHYYCSHPFRHEFEQYLRLTPWSQIEPIGRPNLLKRIKARIKAIVKPAIDLL